MNPYILAVSANLSFAFGSMFFTHYARRFSSIWMNTAKAAVAMSCFFIAILISGEFHTISPLNFGVFFISGFLALGIGDIFLIEAFRELGPARTMVIFGCHPIIVGFFSFLLFGQIVETSKLIGIIFFIICLFIFAFERFKATRKWDVRGLLFAVLGMSIDAGGVIITRYAFDMNDEISAFEGNMYRCFGALVAYYIISFFKPFHFFSGIKSLTWKSRGYVIMGGFFGTFLSLGLYLQAIKTAHLASISAISITSVIFGAMFESIFHKTWPSRYLLLAFVFFCIGMWQILS